MADEKKQAALDMATEELEQEEGKEVKVHRDTLSLNSKYGEAPDLVSKEDQEDNEDEEDQDEDQEGQEDEEQENNKPKGEDNSEDEE